MFFGIFCFNFLKYKIENLKDIRSSIRLNRNFSSLCNSSLLFLYIKKLTPLAKNFMMFKFSLFQWLLQQTFAYHAFRVVLFFCVFFLFVKLRYLLWIHWSSIKLGQCYRKRCWYCLIPVHVWTRPYNICSCIYSLYDHLLNVIWWKNFAICTSLIEYK